MANEPLWLNRIIIEAIHAGQIREHGGLLGVRDENALESALDRPRNKWNYEPDADLASLAAAYAFAFARNHPYNDGNKRLALLAMLTFVSINGCDVEANDEDILGTMIALADGRVTESKLTAWLRARLVRIK